MKSGSAHTLPVIALLPALQRNRLRIQGRILLAWKLRSSHVCCLHLTAIIFCNTPAVSAPFIAVRATVIKSHQKHHVFIKPTTTRGKFLETPSGQVEKPQKEPIVVQGFAEAGGKAGPACSSAITTTKPNFANTWKVSSYLDLITMIAC
jgi:hypothetical protein